MLRNTNLRDSARQSRFLNEVLSLNAQESATGGGQYTVKNLLNEVLSLNAQELPSIGCRSLIMSCPQ